MYNFRLGSSQLCLVRFTPPGFGGRRHRLVCVLNNDPGSTQEAELLGQGAVPGIEATSDGWEGDSDRALSLGGSLGSGSEAEMERDARRVVYMRPTCVGIVASGTFKVQQCSGSSDFSRGSVISFVIYLYMPAPQLGGSVAEGCVSFRRGS